jgi:hypothetical protein
LRRVSFTNPFTTDCRIGLSSKLVLIAPVPPNSDPCKSTRRSNPDGLSRHLAVSRSESDAVAPLPVSQRARAHRGWAATHLGASHESPQSTHTSATPVDDKSATVSALDGGAFSAVVSVRHSLRVNEARLVSQQPCCDGGDLVGFAE